MWLKVSSNAKEAATDEEVEEIIREKKPAEKFLDLATTTAGMTTAEFIALMADLDSDSKKVHVSLSTLVNACNKCYDYVERLAFLGEEHDKLVSQNKDLVVLLDKQKEETACHKYLESCLKTKVKSLEKDNKEANRLICEKVEDYKFQLKVLGERDETIVKMQLEIVEKQKIITELRKKLD